MNYQTREKRQYEISERGNQLAGILNWAENAKYLLGFNNVHYDDLIIMYLIKNKERLLYQNYLEITNALKEFSDLIISDTADYKQLNKYKYNKPWVPIDIFLYWSKLTRKSRKLSLKSFAINLNWPKVQELPIHHDSLVKLEEIPLLLSYNMNDVLVTDALAHNKKSDISLRSAALKRYGFDCLSWDGVKLGLNIIIKRYCDRVNKKKEDVISLRTYRNEIDIGEIIMPIVAFKDADISYMQVIEDKGLVTKFKSFRGLYEYLKTLKVTNTRQINCQVFMNGVRYDVKSGGLHTYHNPGVVHPVDMCYRDKDVSSWYPTLSAMHNIVPEHLGPESAEELNSMREERLDMKAKGLGKSNDAELLKLAMNGGWYGNMNNEYTPMYDPKALLKVTINGQLLLLMLCEWLIDIGVIIDMCNTDGITIIYKPELHDKVEELCKKWEDLARAELETVEYIKVVRMNINNYMAIYKEKGEIKVKEKGVFLTNPPIDQSRDMLVIPKALKAYFKEGIPPDEFIRNHTEIYDFCASKKVDKKYDVYWGGKVQQRLNRYYVSKKGPYLYKSKDGVKMEHMMKDWSVELFNDYVEKPMLEYNINFEYYISEARKLISELEPSQKLLFNDQI